jgi:hypothetical protein
MVIANFVNSETPTIVEIPRSIQRSELIKLMPTEWITNYENCARSKNLSRHLVPHLENLLMEGQKPYFNCQKMISQERVSHS